MNAVGSVVGLCTVGARWNQDSQLLEPSSLLINPLPRVFLSTRRATDGFSDSESVLVCPVLDCGPHSKSGSVLFHIELPARADSSVSASFVRAVFLEPFKSTV